MRERHGKQRNGSDEFDPKSQRDRKVYKSERNGSKNKRYSSSSSSDSEENITDRRKPEKLNKRRERSSSEDSASDYDNRKKESQRRDQRHSKDNYGARPKEYISSKVSHSKMSRSYSSDSSD